MRVKVTVYYGEDGKALTRETRDYRLPDQDDDPEGFEEALDYITETVLDAYQLEGHDLEDDEEEDHAIGIDYLAAWVLPEWFDTRSEAITFMKQLISDTSQALEDLE